MPAAEYVARATPQKKGKVVASLRRSGNMAEAARLVGVNRRTVYRWQEEDAEFAAACEDAREAYRDELEAEADRRGYRGIIKPVFYQGEHVADIKEYSDVLLIFRLKGERPEKYREIPKGIDPQVVNLFLQQVLVRVDDATRDALIGWVEERMGLLTPGAPAWPEPAATADERRDPHAPSGDGA